MNAMKKTLALLLVFALALSCLPLGAVTAFAAEADETQPPTEGVADADETATETSAEAPTEPTESSTETTEAATEEPTEASTDSTTVVETTTPTEETVPTEVSSTEDTGEGMPPIMMFSAAPCQR